VFPQEAAERRALAAQQAADAVEATALQRLEVCLNPIVGVDWDLKRMSGNMPRGQWVICIS
jgi:hypothetical protein